MANTSNISFQNLKAQDTLVSSVSFDGLLTDKQVATVISSALRRSYHNGWTFTSEDDISNIDDFHIQFTRDDEDIHLWTVQAIDDDGEDFGDAQIFRSNDLTADSTSFNGPYDAPLQFVFTKDGKSAIATSNDDSSKNPIPYLDRSVGGEISGDVEVLGNFSIVGKNFVQTNDPSHVEIYSRSPTFMQVEYLEGYRNPSSGTKGYALLGVISSNQIKLSSANDGADLSDLTAYITEDYSPLWSISLSGGMLPQYFKILSVDGQIVTLDKELRDIYNTGKSNEYRWYALSNESEEWFASIAGIPNNAFYCIDMISAGNLIVNSGITHNEGAINATVQHWTHAEGCDNIAEGRYAHVEGYMNKALGLASHSEGLGTTAEGPRCHSEGSQTFAGYGYAAHAEGHKTSALTSYSHAEGYYTEASGQYSHTEGYNTKAFGNGSHAEGNSASAIANYSHVEGLKTTAESLYSHAEGMQTSAVGDAALKGYQFYNDKINFDTNEIILSTKTLSYVKDDLLTFNVDDIEYPACSKILNKVSVDIDGTVNWKISVDILPISTIKSSISKIYAPLKPTIGYNTLYSSNSVHAEGYKTIASKLWSHAEGGDVIASGGYSHAEGYGSKASNYATHAEGFNTIASGQYSHAEGYCTSAIANYSHAEGSRTYVKGQFSHAEGASTSALSGWSHAEGRYCVANGQYAHVEGLSCEANANQTHAAGRKAYANHDNSWIWNGDNSTQYETQSSGSFNVNPKNDISGFYIGDRNLNDIIKEKAAEAGGADGKIAKESLISALNYAGITEPITSSDIDLGNVLQFLAKISEILQQ